MSSPNAVISVSELVFDYPGKRALSSVSFEVARGEIIALVGPNGAGKTTLLRCIAGLQDPLSGGVRVAGISAIENRRECHKRLGYLSDFFGLYDALTAQQCLIYMAWAHGLRGADAERAARRAAERVELVEYLHAGAGTLSRGLRQRLAIAQALVHEPAVLLLDEPAAGLDPEARQSLARLLTTLREQGTTLIVSSHLLTELEDYSTEMLVLSAGQIVERRAVRPRAAPVRVYALHVVGDATAALGVLQAMPALRDVRLDADRIVFECDGDAAFRAELLASLAKQGVAFSAFHEHSDDMQALYLAALSARRERGDES